MTHEAEKSSPPSLSQQWSRARDDYLAGVSAPVVAERYSLSERTLRRRAAVEGWRRTDQPTVDLDQAPVWNRGPLSREEAIEAFPELEEVELASSNDRFVLLFDPDPKNLRRYAFRRAAEAAALSRPAEAVVWMRLVQSLERAGERIDAEARPFQDEDYLRAAYLNRLNAEFGSDPTPDEA